MPLTQEEEAELKARRVRQIKDQWKGPRRQGPALSWRFYRRGNDSFPAARITMDFNPETRSFIAYYEIRLGQIYPAYGNPNPVSIETVEVLRSMISKRSLAECTAAALTYRPTPPPDWGGRKA